MTSHRLAARILISYWRYCHEKRAFLLSLAVLLFAIPPVMAYAANQTEMSTVITYTVDAPSTSEPEPPAPAPATYEINIPASLSLNIGNEIRITANIMNINADQNVVVTLDTAGYNGWIELISDSMDTDRIPITINRYNHVFGGIERVHQGDVVARFNNSGTTPIEYGLLTVLPSQTDVDSAPPGTYTATVRFKIALVTP